MAFVELHAYTAFNFLRGASSPEAMAARAAALGLPALAVHDRDGVYGAPRFFAAAKECGIRPLCGCELTLAPAAENGGAGGGDGGGRGDGGAGPGGAPGAILPVLVENRTGYENLCRLITRAKLRGTKTAAAVRPAELAEFADGLVAMVGPGWGLAAPAGGARWLRDLFGRGRVVVGVWRHRVRGEEREVRRRRDLAAALGLDLVATNRPCYTGPAGRRVADLFTCIRHHTDLDRAGLLLARNAERQLLGETALRELFADLPAAVANTGRVAERLQFSLADLGYEFPRFAVPPGETMDSFLRQVTMAGARARYGHFGAKVRAQLERELALIAKLGFAGYFLVVWDLVNFCSEQNIMVQGRGSAANSAVCYSLGITAVDPVGADLLFERFLSEGRQGWPDIDLDLPSGARREAVIQEVYRRYGPTGAAMTANVITFRGRGAAREIGKALGLPEDLLGRFAALFGHGDFPHTLELTAQMARAGLAKEHPRAAAFADLYGAVRGLPRHLGQHSGGMIICQGMLDRVVPLERATMPGRVVAQWDKDDCADLGIVKVDLLGLGMMAVLQDALETCAARGRPVDLATIPKDDPATYDLMCRADTVGVFQIESRAQMATLPRMQPRQFYDLVVEVAIIRPGPIQGRLTHPYLARRAGKEPVTYYDERLRPVLERTLGVPLFQEQVLRIAMIMADFSGAEAEELRRALSFNRSPERMAKVAAKLRAAMARHGVAPAVGERVVAALSSFALYGFPESHAISFALLAYASAWLKVHRPVEFYAGLLNNQPLGFYAPDTLLKDARRHGIRALPVDVGQSGWHCAAVADDTLRLGFCVVKGFRRDNAERLIAGRPYRSVDDCRQRSGLGREELRALAELGALNGFAGHRRAALWAAEAPARDGELANWGGDTPVADPADRAAAPAHRLGIPRNGDTLDAGQNGCGPAPGGEVDRGGRQEGHPSLLAGVDPRESVPSAPPAPLRPMTLFERVAADYRGMGLTTGRHPLALVRPRLAGVTPAAGLAAVRSGRWVTIAGAVICRQRPGTAKGVLFLSLEDETGVANAIVAPALFERRRLVITQEPFLAVAGPVQNVAGVIHVQARKIARLPIVELIAATADPAADAAGEEVGGGGGRPAFVGPPAHDFR